jgi:hypothetical protein
MIQRLIVLFGKMLVLIKGIVDKPPTLKQDPDPNARHNQTAVAKYHHSGEGAAREDVAWNPWPTHSTWDCPSSGVYF